MRVLFLTLGDHKRASSRVRVYQYLEPLKELGVESSVMTNPDRLGSRIALVRFLVQLLCKLRWADVVVVQRRIFSHRLTRLICLINDRLIYDMDDAVFAVPSGVKVDLAQHEESIRRINFALLKCKAAVVGNSYLASYVSQFVSHVFIVPTGVDTRLFHFRNAHQQGERFVVGWVGGGEQHLEHLKLLWEPLETIGMRFPTVFRVVGTRGSQRIAEYFASAKYFQPDLIDWVEPAEVPNVVAGFDVGVMPLVDEEYSRGKCGLKALEYMAVGVPTVCSPVGVNKDIIRDGVNGFLAASAEGWVRAFEQIRADRHLRQRMMLEARRTIETEYDVRVLARRLVEIMESVRNNSLR